MDLDAARTAATAARDAAAEAFLATDRAQRFVAARVRSYAELDPGAQAREALEAFSRAGAEADAAAAGWIAAHDTHDPDSATDAGTLEAARAAFDHARDRSLAAHRTLEELAARIAPRLAEAERRLAELPALVRLARDAVEGARDAVRSAAAEGLAPDEAQGVLREAQAGLARLEAASSGQLQGSAALEALRLAGWVRELADRALRLAGERARLREDVRAGLVLAATRADVAASRAEALTPALRTLRREFVGPSWLDVEPRPGAVEALLREGRYAADTARQLATLGRWDEAAGALEEARAALAEARRRAEAVIDRLATLREVRDDPPAQVQGARFAVRDAQRLLLQRGRVPEPRFVTALDALATRIDTAEALLQAPHPDYWRFRSLLLAVREDAARVVADIRRAMAAS